MLCSFCGSETKEYIKVGNVYVIIHHFCHKQLQEENGDARIGASHKGN